MRNLMLKLEYDGTNYHGWQRQNNALGVQEVIENALFKIMGEGITVNGCSRTDAGVHAFGYVCNFFTNSKIPVEKIPYALNSTMPYDIVALSCLEVPKEFHARYGAKRKKYRYRIINRTFPAALDINYSYHWPHTLDFKLIEKCAQYFIGEHDFKAFMGSGSKIKNTVRTIFDIQLIKNNYEIIIEITGNGFLYNMVRIIAGTLLYVGCGKIEESAIPEIIKEGDRRKAGITASPQGLYLVEVYYD